MPRCRCIAIACQQRTAFSRKRVCGGDHPADGKSGAGGKED